MANQFNKSFQEQRLEREREKRKKKKAQHTHILGVFSTNTGPLNDEFLVAKLHAIQTSTCLVGNGKIIHQKQR